MKSGCGATVKITTSWLNFPDCLRLALPALAAYELANLLWQRQKRGEINKRQALGIMSDFERLPLKLVPGDVPGLAALQIARSTGCTADDGAFLALARGLDVPLVTADKRLVRLTAGSRLASHVVWLGDWR